jgi:hypothetical protein
VTHGSLISYMLNSGKIGVAIVKPMNVQISVPSKGISVKSVS